jgi:hypothetical protein
MLIQTSEVANLPAAPDKNMTNGFTFTHFPAKGHFAGMKQPALHYINK